MNDKRRIALQYLRIRLRKLKELLLETDNDISELQDKENCAFDCAYFVAKRK